MPSGARMALGGAVLIVFLVGPPLLMAWLALRGARAVAREAVAAAEAERDQALREKEQALARVPDPGFDPRASTAVEPEAGGAAAQREPVEGWYSQALQDMAQAGMARGWADVRDDAMPEDATSAGLSIFHGRVESLPFQIGRELAQQRGRQELIESGIEQAGVLAVLEGIEEQIAGPLPELLADGQRFGALFACDQSGPEIQEEEFLRSGGPDTGLADGTTVRFGPGVKRVYLWIRRGNSPRCLTLEGAGMDQTLIVAPAFQESGTSLDRLTIRDCTIYSQSLLSLRSRGAQVLVERVRVIGFDEGTDSGICLRLDKTALLMRECRFEAGYGKDAKAVARLFDVRTEGLLARFERCRFDGIRLDLAYVPARATVVFDGCTMTDLRDRVDPRSLERPGLRFVDCSVYLGNPDDAAVRGRDLEQLFPGWSLAR